MRRKTLRFLFGQLSDLMPLIYKPNRGKGRFWGNQINLRHVVYEVPVDSPAMYNWVYYWDSGERSCVEKY